MPKFTDWLKHSWNVFTSRDPTNQNEVNFSEASSYRPDRYRSYRYRSGDKTIITSIENRIAIDCAAIDIRHVKLDENGRYKEDVKSSLNDILTVEANIDQTSRSFIQDAVQIILETGHVALVITEANVNPELTESYQIQKLRAGVVTQWFPKHVKVNLYNEETGKHQEVILPKKNVAIVQNPLYSVMNEHNSTLQRLLRKLSILDAVDEQAGSGKLDLIIQLPYVIKTEARKKQAENRRKDIEMQLAGSRYGIAYTDGTERITQLNRPAENNLLKTIEYLTDMLYGQLGITAEVINGTADEKTMLNYHNRTVEPIMSAIVLEMRRKFLSKTARTQGQSIQFFRDPFRLVPVQEIAEISDKLTRNEIATPNEIRSVIGWKPADDQNADQLRNRNISQSAEEIAAQNGETPVSDIAEQSTQQEQQNGSEEFFNSL